MNPLLNARLILAAVVFVLLTGCATTPDTVIPATVGDRAAAHALRMIGKPYRYGGRSPRGFDCSGLVYFSYAKTGVHLPRSTAELRQRSQPVAPDELRRGDLLFFNQESKPSSHVAIYIGDDRFVHAPSTGKRVRIASLEDPYWRNHFVGGRRLQIE